ncbi:MAG: hypothetical protein ABSE56_02450 [Bryobacteraceae bacterium]|jgi:hypothetical protein
MYEPVLPGDPAPADLPDIQAPAPNFMTVGQQLEQGRQAAGPDQGWLAGLGQMLQNVFAWLIGCVVNAAMWIAAKLAGILAKGEEGNQAEFGELAANSISNLFGVSVSPGAMGARGQVGSRTQVYGQVGAAVMNAMVGAGGMKGSGTLTPGTGPAEQYLGAVTHLAIEGWIEEWLVDATSLHVLGRFGELKDTLEHVLGIGRLSHEALKPLMQVILQTPLTWDLMKRYRPTLLGVAQAWQQYVRGKWSLDQVQEELARQGYDSDRTEAALNSQRVRLGPSELDYTVARDYYSFDDAVQCLVDQGYEKAVATDTLNLLADKRCDAWRRRIVDQLITAFGNQDIEQPDFVALMQATDLPKREQDYARILAAHILECRRTRLTLAQIATHVKNGIQTVDDFRNRMVELRYSTDDQTALELELLYEVKNAADAAAAKKAIAEQKAAAAAAKTAAAEAKRQAALAALELKKVSLAREEELVTRGIRTLDSYSQWLRDHDFPAADVADLTTLLGDKINAAANNAAAKTTLVQTAAKKKLSIPQLERAVKLSLMSVDEYRSQLAAAGFSDSDRNLLASMLQAELDKTAAAQKLHDETQAELEAKQVSLADLELAVREGIQNVDWFQAQLTARGIDADNAALLTDELRQKLQADQAAVDLHTKAAATLKKKKVSLADLDKAARNGLITLADYSASLAADGYGPSDVDMLVGLLQLQMAADKKAADTHTAAAAKLAQKSISLVDLERAVKLGVTDITTYKAALTREGFNADDQDILVQSLLAQIAVTRAAQQKAAEAAKKATAKKISLTDLAKAVRLGQRPLADYQATLADLGYAAADQASLVALLQEQMTADQAAAKKEAAAAAKLQDRGLSLSQWEQSVVAGVRTIAAFRAWLLSQGLVAEDADAVVSLVQLKMAPKVAAKTP